MGPRLKHVECFIYAICHHLINPRQNLSTQPALCVCAPESERLVCLYFLGILFRLLFVIFVLDTTVQFMHTRTLVYMHVEHSDEPDFFFTLSNHFITRKTRIEMMKSKKRAPKIEREKWNPNRVWLVKQISIPPIYLLILFALVFSSRSLSL